MHFAAAAAHDDDDVFVDSRCFNYQCTFSLAVNRTLSRPHTLTSHTRTHDALANGTDDYTAVEYVNRTLSITH